MIALVAAALLVGESAAAAAPAGAIGPWPVAGSVALPEENPGGEVREANGASLAFLWLIRGYQRFLSGRTGGRCNFYPSCSRFGYACVKQHSIAGIPIVTDRLLRCHPGAWTGEAHGATVNDRLYDPPALHVPWGDAAARHRASDRERAALFETGSLAVWHGWE